MFQRGGLVHHTLLSMARQRPGVDERRCGAMLEFLAAAESVHRRIWPSIPPCHSEEAQFLILVVLFSLHPTPCTPGILAEYAGCSRTAVTRSLGLLERRGWIERTHGAADRRFVQVRLTAQGRTASDRQLWRFLCELSEAADTLPPGQALRLGRFCSALATPELEAAAPLSP